MAVILISGACGGIGGYFTGALRAQDNDVVACDISGTSKLADSTIPAVREKEIMYLDVCDYGQCEAIVSDIKKRWGKLDALINCAGIAEPAIGTLEQNVELWERVVAVNLKGTYNLSKAATAVIKENSGGGSIINLSSIAGLVGFQAANAYGPSKAGVAMLTKTLAVDLAKWKIRVNALAPGLIETPMLGAPELLGHKTLARLTKNIPLRRLGQPADLYGLVEFLLSDASSYITGAVIPVDGGWTAWGGA